MRRADRDGGLHELNLKCQFGISSFSILREKSETGNPMENALDYVLLLDSALPSRFRKCVPGQNRALLSGHESRKSALPALATFERAISSARAINGSNAGKKKELGNVGQRHNRRPCREPTHPRCARPGRYPVQRRSVA